ncbi:WD40 repeat protein [Hamadaea flava]|uniref:Uncharacterized protein n=1 Tax=Hamadaea flava TaxID=1742688 RepID=A0ABV8LJ12_9ACTN|nr:hypothetical protein [Hamadaea flava]MCP2324877.1 WD40 repeat protein [Hamadaea flava]
MNAIPEDLDGAVRAVAEHAPGGYATLAEITARGRQARRRRTVAVSSLAAFAVLGSALGVPLVVKRADGRTGPQPETSATTAAPTPTSSPSPRIWTSAAQRLLLNGSGGSVTHSDGSQAGIDGPTGPTELLPTGKVRALRTPTFNAGVVDLLAKPDGGLVMLGIQNLQPGVARTDGPNVSGLEIRLVVVRPDGTTSSKRNIRVQGEYVSLLAADEDTAILWRKHGVFRRTIATGQEERLVSASAIAGGNVDDAQTRIGAVSLVGQAIAVVRPMGPCPTIQIGSLTSGTHRQLTLRGNPRDCGVGDMRFSPDGTSLAVAYGQRSAKDVRLAVFDTATGALVSDSALYSTPDPVGLMEPGTAELRGLAWLDDRTVRAAVTALPHGATRTYRYTELLRIVDLQVR